MAKKKAPTHSPLLLNPEHIDYSDLTGDQKRGADLFDEWYHTPKRKLSDMVFRLGGVSGTGKSFLIRYLIERYKFSADECYVVAYTGQAVNVLRRSGIIAKTIHSTFMKVKEVPLFKDGKPVIRRGIPVTRMKFTPIKVLPPEVKLIICDEASFLPEDLEKMMLRYNVPIMETGDPIQLPPVAGKQCFHMGNLDWFMEDIMRQSLDSEIVRLSNSIRHYMPIDSRAYGQDVRFLWAQESLEATFNRYLPFIRGSDMIMALKNKDRRYLIDLYRDKVIKTNSPYPVKGERLICRQNDWNLMLGPYPLTNGTQGYAVHTVGKSEVNRSTKTFLLDFRPTFLDDEYFDGLLCDTEFIRRMYGDKDAEDACRYNPGKKFEFGHVITVHSAQGSSAKTAMFFDSFLYDAEYHMRIRYTAVTRAEQKLYYVLPRHDKYPGWTDLWRGGFRPDAKR